ncbi:transcriptional regulator [Pseudomonas piscis]|uniref:transcriptional regulator n=1 Tax=Pseudomonas piscis TaxID=2614538 RepID=UPI0021D5B396|nr:transcriptional regulator [Pseudomonas piscis]MCU7646474.1 transcriptional regulator [Pseudomonas piscis]
MSRCLFCAAFFTAGLCFAAQAQEPLPSVQEVMSEHKEKIKNQIESINYNRKRMVEANMGLDSEQAETFWPIYSRYRNEMDSLSKESFQLLVEYARAYGSGAVNNQDATSMLKTYKALQEKQRNVLFRHIDQMSARMSPVIAMRFLQIEEQLDAMEVLQTGNQIPLIK